MEGGKWEIVLWGGFFILPPDLNQLFRMKKNSSGKSSRLIMGTMRLGAWGANFSTSQYIEFIEQCIEWGITTFDLADIYGDHTQERDFGLALKERPDLRDRLELISKCGICRPDPNRPQYTTKYYDTSAAHIRASVEQSLADLHTDHLDQLLIHRPDALMDPAEIADAIDALRAEGKVKAFGVSNFTPAQFDLLNQFTPLSTNQVQVNLLHLDPFLDGTFDQLLAKGVAPQAWSPLGGGALFQPGDDPQLERIRATAADLGKKYNAALDQLLLAFLLRHPSGIRPVLGTTKTDRVKSAVDALHIQLSREDWYTLWSASTGHPVP